LFPQFRRSREDVDGHLVGLVFVRRIAPLETIGIGGAKRRDQRHAGLHRPEYLTI
jgi:hypothetical protein